MQPMLPREKMGSPGAKWFTASVSIVSSVACTLLP
jgi:hypothetical protein